MRLHIHIPYAALLFSCIASTTPTKTTTTMTTARTTTTPPAAEPARNGATAQTHNVDVTYDDDSPIATTEVGPNVRFRAGRASNRDETSSGNNSRIRPSAASESSRDDKHGRSNKADDKIAVDMMRARADDAGAKTLLHCAFNSDSGTLQLGDDCDAGHPINQRDIDDAVDAGLKMMNDLRFVKEPLLHSMGLSLDESEAAGRVASFSKPTQQALRHARYGYAAIQASLRIREKHPESRSRRNPEHVSFLRTDAFADQCPLRGTPRCPPAARRYRTADGTCNNLDFPWKGASMLPMQRFLLPEYQDDVQAIRRSYRSGARLPSAREVSIRIHRDRDVEMSSITMMFVQWGQFVDHDITSTAQSRAFNASIPRCCARGGADFLPPEFTHPECLPIEVPDDDWFLGRAGIRCIEFVRSAPSSRVNCDLGWREQINQVTSYVDASTVYGSDAARADSLRIFRDGLLQYGRVRRAGQTPPDPPGGELCRLGALSTECFKGGDTRVGEQPGLTAFHTVWLRYHNRIAAIFGNLNPHWSDEKTYQETRRIVGALMQHITYKEFLPIVLGREVMDLFELNVERKGYFRDYDSRVNPAPANAFSSAAFRFGHSLVQHSFLRSDSKHRLLVNNVSIHEELDNHENIWSFGSVDRLILGFCNQPSQRRDEFISRELTHHLFQQPGQPFGMDLAAVNIQRGRDHGIPGYTAWREPCGLSPIRTWADLETLMNSETIRRFRSLYEHVDDIDLYPGGLAERPIRGGIVGPTFGCIIAQQFANLRRGDRFWYENGGFENSFTPAQLQQIRRVTFAQVLCQVLPEIESVQPFVFLSPDNFRNSRVSCDAPDMESLDLRAWEERRLAQNQLPKAPPPPPIAAVHLGADGVQVSAPNAASSVGVNGRLDDLAAKIEFITGDQSRTGPQTHLGQKVHSKLDFTDGVKIDEKLATPDGVDISDNRDFTSVSNAHQGNRNHHKDKLQQKPILNVNDNIAFNNKHKIGDDIKLTTTTKQTTDVTDIDIIFLAGTNAQPKGSENSKEIEDVDLSAMFDSPGDETSPGRIIKRSAEAPETEKAESREPYEIYDFFDDIISDDKSPSGWKHMNAPKTSRNKPGKSRLTTTTQRTTTRRNVVQFQNRPLISDFYNPLKIKVTNITTSTIDLESDDGHIANANFNAAKTKPLTHYQTTRRPLTYDQDDHYVLHPTINEPNRHKLTQTANYGDSAKIQVASDPPNSPDYQVNINIHLVSSTPTTDISISDKYSNPSIHVVDGSRVNYEQIKPSYGHVHYAARPPAPITPIRTTTKRPDYYRLRPTPTSSQPYYDQPTTYNYDQFEDRPFSTSKRPYIYRPSEGFLAMFDEMQQRPHVQEQYGLAGAAQPTYAISHIDKENNKRPTIPSYLYYDGKYFNENGQQHSQYGQTGAGIMLPADAFYNRHTAQGSHQTHTNAASGEKNFIKISSVLGNRYLHNTDKEQYIHTAQQREGELELDPGTNTTDTRQPPSDNITSSHKHDTRAVGIQKRASHDAVSKLDRDVELIDVDAADAESKLQIDIFPRESRRGDWVIYEPDSELAVMDEPEITPNGERVADELPKPMSDFWKKHPVDDDDDDADSDATDKEHHLDNGTGRTL